MKFRHLHEIALTFSAFYFYLPFSETLTNTFDDQQNTVFLSSQFERNLFSSTSINKKMYCSTFIFATTNSNQNLDNSNNLLIFYSIFHTLKTPLTYYNFQSFSSIPFHNKSFLNHEWTESDFKLNLVWNNIKHGRQCSLTLLLLINYVSSTHEEHEDETIQMANQLLHLKLVRPNIDYFVFVGPEPKIINNFVFNQNLSILQDLKFKYGLVVSKLPNYNNNNNNSFSLISSCHSELFSTQCDPVIVGKHLHVSAVFGPQMLRIYNTTTNSSTPPPSKNTLGGGIYYEILAAASSTLNFTFTVRTSFRGTSGFKRNDTWFGAVGEVFNRQSDFAVTAAMTSQRLTIVDPTSTMCWIKRIFFIRRSPLATNWTAIFKPLQWIVWGLTFVAVLITIPLYFYSTRSTQGTVNKPRKNSSSRKENILIQLITTFAVFYRLILEQSWNEHADQIGFTIRYLITIWAGFCLVLTTSYRSKLMNFLTFLTSEPVPSTHSGLIHDHYKLYFRYYGGVAYEYYRTSKLPEHQEIFRRAILINTSYECMISAALTPHSACLDYDFHGSYAVLTNATLHTSSDPTNHELFLRSSDAQIPIPMPWAFRKGSPILQHFNEFILQCLATGLYDHWLDNDWYKGKSDGVKWLQSQQHSLIRKQLEESFDNLHTINKPLNVESLVGLGLILGGGLTLALFIWIGEILIRKYYSDRKRIVMAEINQSTFVQNHVHLWGSTNYL